MPSDGLITVHHDEVSVDAALARKLREALAHCCRSMDGVRIESMDLVSDVFPPCYAEPRWGADHDGKRETKHDPLEALLWALEGLNESLSKAGHDSRVREGR